MLLDLCLGAINMLIISMKDGTDVLIVGRKKGKKKKKVSSLLSLDLMYSLCRVVRMISS